MMWNECAIGEQNVTACAIYKNNNSLCYLRKQIRHCASFFSFFKGSNFSSTGWRSCTNQANSGQRNWLNWICSMNARLLIVSISFLSGCLLLRKIPGWLSSKSVFSYGQCSWWCQRLRGWVYAAVVSCHVVFFHRWGVCFFCQNVIIWYYLDVHSECDFSFWIDEDVFSVPPPPSPPPYLALHLHNYLSIYSNYYYLSSSSSSFPILLSAKDANDSVFSFLLLLHLFFFFFFFPFSLLCAH